MDTYVDGASPAKNYGKSAALYVRLSPDTRSYLRFIVSGLGGKTIARASLMIYANTSGKKGISAWTVADSSWGELTMTYANAPALGKMLVTSGPIPGGEWVSLDVTSYITGEGTYSFGLTTSGATAINLASHESGSNAPMLVLVFK
jgi:hypothetical protein